MKEHLHMVRRVAKWALWALLGLVLVLVIAGYAARTYQFWDKDPDRGAIAMPEKDALGDSYQKVVYLQQGWKPEQSLWFYNTTQGSDLMPYDFFLALEQEKSPKRFLDNANVNAYRYLPQKPTSSNPDGLPVGFVLDHYKGKDYVGLTCAACHTNQVNYKGTAMRIDGGPAGSDMERFMVDLGRAMADTQTQPEKKQRFVQAVLAKGRYKSTKDVEDDLALFTTRLQAYTFFNEPTQSYRYGRLDAFGRIYNRVLEHIMTGDQLRSVLKDELSPAEFDKLKPELDGVLTAKQRDSVITRLSKFLTAEQMVKVRGRIFNSPNAPVSYPFLWDISQHDYVQWNGLASNGGLGPLGRNAGEVIGVFGTLDWAQKEQGWFQKLVTGQSDTPYQVNYESSVDVHNLVRIENQLRHLQSPQWPQDILGKLDTARVDRGRKLYESHCIACHDIIDRTDPKRRVVASMSGLDVVKTDPQMARNSVNHSGYSGILRNLYVGTSVGEDALIQSRAPVALLLTKADMNVILTPDPDKWRVRAWLERLYDYVTGFTHNEIKSSIKQGNYTPDTTAQPFNSLQAYKGRPLNGIWATAPYLHNGSVPTLYDLLLPADKSKAGKDGEFRPQTFRVGSRELDPAKVGFRTDVGDVFDTRLQGNTNVGHEYGAAPLALPDGKTLRGLNREERLDLVEFMKSL
jgi:cytochrome c5